MGGWFRHHRELVSGIALGIVLGLIVIALFVFVFSEDTVDGPQIDEQPAPAATTPSAPPKATP